MLDVKEAAQKASEYFAALYSNKKPSNVRLEEVELTDDGRYWLITLSSPISDLATILGRDAEREYKVFKIDAGSGEVQSMKIRKV